MSVSTENNRAKKAQRREAKALKKAANTKEERNRRPNNLLLFLLIFGVIFGMFAFVYGHQYFEKEPSIETFILKNESYQKMELSENSVLNVTAKKNDMKMVFDITTDDKDEIKQVKEYYSGKDGKKELKLTSSYYLTSIKPQTRAIKASVSTVVNLNGEKLQSTKLTYRQAKKFLEKEMKAMEAEGETTNDNSN